MAAIHRIQPMPALMVLALGLAGCDQGGAPDDVVRHPRAAEIARITPAEEALANAQVPKLDPATMNDAEIRKALEAGPRCQFRYTSSGRPVLVVSAQPGGPGLGGVVKLNGHLVPLQATPAEGGGVPPGSLLLTAGPIRVTVTPDGGEQAAEAGVMPRREASMVFEVGQELKAGYRGYLGCDAGPPAGAPPR